MRNSFFISGTLKFGDWDRLHRDRDRRVRRDSKAMLMYVVSHTNELNNVLVHVQAQASIALYNAVQYKLPWKLKEWGHMNTLPHLLVILSYFVDFSADVLVKTVPHLQVRIFFSFVSLHSWAPWSSFSSEIGTKISTKGI